MNVRELIILLNTVENKDLPVFAAVGDHCLVSSSVEIYEDAVEIWTRSEVQ